MTAATTPVRAQDASARAGKGPDRSGWGRLQVATHSQRGVKAGVNEDSVLAFPPNFVGVADGVGGGAHGEVASAVLLRHCAATPSVDGGSLADWAASADAMVAKAIAACGANAGAATLVACWRRGNAVKILNVGDARGYIFQTRRKDSAPVWRSRDQTYAAEKLSPPDGAAPDDPCFMIGSGCFGVPQLHATTIRPGQMVLLCSDGLHRCLSDEQISRIVQVGTRRKDALVQIAGALARAAANAGGRDDISVALLYRPARFAAHPAYWTLLALTATFAAGVAAGWIPLVQL